jgi:Sec-independent protein translocase protein TatA
MLLLNDLSLLALAPQQIALALAIALVIFAPRLIPPVARLLGKLIGRAARARAGIPRCEYRNGHRIRTITVEDVPPEPEETPAFRMEGNAKTHSNAPSPLRTILPVMVVVSGAVAVILWVLLHAR